jgi:hypothetical protein
MDYRLHYRVDLFTLDVLEMCLSGAGQASGTDMRETEE